jgi:hypothetical protein
MPDMRSLSAAFQTYLLSRDRRPRTIESYLKDIEHFAEWFVGS